MFEASTAVKFQVYGF